MLPSSMWNQKPTTLLSPILVSRGGILYSVILSCGRQCGQNRALTTIECEDSLLCMLVYVLWEDAAGGRQQRATSKEECMLILLDVPCQNDFMDAALSHWTTRPPNMVLLASSIGMCNGS